MFKNFRGMKELIAHSVREHQASLDPDSPRDFIDCFLTKMAQVNPAWKSHFCCDPTQSCGSGLKPRQT